jgi:hypothetical protein
VNEAASAAVPERSFIMKVNRLPAFATILLLAAIPSISLAEGSVKIRSPTDGAVWCAQRFGQSLSFLPDGRVIQIAGEHEDVPLRARRGGSWRRS